MATELEQLLTEKAARLARQEERRGLTTGLESVLEEPKETSILGELKQFTESISKGSAAGLLDVAAFPLTMWAKVHERLKKDKIDPSSLTSQGLVNIISDLGGPKLNKIDGYKGAYEVGRAGAPAAALSALGLPGLFGNSAKGLAAEYVTAGSTGALAQTIAPDSPLSQFLMQSSPYALAGSVKGGRAFTSRPKGELPPNAQEMIDIAPMTPGELTGNRAQLAKEGRVEASVKIGEEANIFRQTQAKTVEDFVTKVIERTTSSAREPIQAAQKALDAFTNYGKALSGRLSSEARRDFGAAKASGGKVDTTPILSVINEKIAGIPPELVDQASMRAALLKIKDEFLIPGTPASVTPSTILGPTGQPASVTTTAAVAEKALEIDIDRLQKNLSAWGEAAYSGQANFGKGNIFEGVAPGQAKGVARAVLNGFRQSLDEAIANGVPGADKLVKARDNFKSNLSHIEEFANRPLAKFFDVPTASSITPEDIMVRLGKAKPSERVFLADVLQNHPEASMVWDTVRRSKLEDALVVARKAAAGAAEGSPNINLNVLLKELNNKKGDFGYLVNAADQPAMNDALLWLQKVAKTAKETSGNTRTDIYSSVRGGGGSAQLGLLLGEASALARAVLEDPRAISAIVFNPETAKKLLAAKNKGVPYKMLEAIRDVSIVTGQQAVRAIPRVSTSNVEDASATPPNSPEAAQPNQLDLLQAELARRKAEQQ